MATASANDLTAFTPEIWSPSMQNTFFKESTALGVVNADLRAELSIGDTLHKPYGSYARVQTYTKGTDITVKDIDTTDDYITVNTAKVASFYVDNLDLVQNKYEVVKEFASGAMRQLNNVLDQAVLGQYSNAGTTLDAGDVGGTAGSGIILDVSNCPSIFTAAGRVLNNNKRLGGSRFAMIGPRMLEIIQNYVGGRETGFGDTVSDNGVVGNRFSFRLVLSNNLPFSAVFDMDTILTDTDTITINGVTLTADADGAATGAGHFSIQANADLCNAQIASCINDDGTPGVDTYIALSSDDRQLFEECGIVAVADTEANTLTITGYGDIVVSTSNSVSAAWSSQTQYALMGIDGAVSLIAQVAPTVVFRDPTYRLGKVVHPWMLYGVGTFERNTDQLVAVQFDVSNWV